MINYWHYIKKLFSFFKKPNTITHYDIINSYIKTRFIKIKKKYINELTYKYSHTYKDNNSLIKIKYYIINNTNMYDYHKKIYFNNKNKIIINNSCLIKKTAFNKIQKNNFGCKFKYIHFDTLLFSYVYRPINKCCKKWIYISLSNYYYRCYYFYTNNKIYINTYFMYLNKGFNIYNSNIINYKLDFLFFGILIIDFFYIYNNQY